MQTKRNLEFIGKLRWGESVAESTWGTLLYWIPLFQGFVIMSKTQYVVRLSVAAIMAVMATFFVVGTSSAVAEPAAPAVCPTPLPTSGTHLCVTVLPDGSNPVPSWRLNCQPPSVDWGVPPFGYDPTAACKALLKHPEAIPPVPPDILCLQVFYGPERANLRGYYQGQWINANFSRNNSCEENRWQALKPVFGSIAA
jgi:hypothetical protein